VPDHHPESSLERRRAREVAVRRPGALERKTVAVYDTTTEGMVGLEFVRTRRWLVYIAAAIVFAVACGFLANWQYDRGRKAVSYNARIEQNWKAAPMPLASVLPKLDSYRFADDFQRATVSGEYLADEQLYVRTRPCGDSTGFEVLTPLRAEDGKVLVVDRGCLDASATDPQRPASTPKPPAGPVELVVRIEPGEAAKGSTPAIENQIESIDLKQVQRRLGGEVYTGAYGLLDSQSPAPAAQLGSVLASPPTAGTVVHWSYMVQWALFGVLGFVGLWYALRLEFRRINADDPEERERARKRRQKAARKKFTDAETEDEILDGFVPLSRWGVDGAVAVAPVPAERPALTATPIADDEEAPSQPRQARRTQPDVIVIQPSRVGEPGTSGRSDAGAGSDGAGDETAEAEQAGGDQAG
jgi:cytochrome oxidase assembly protein ShyY1